MLTSKAVSTMSTAKNDGYSNLERMLGLPSVATDDGYSNIVVGRLH
jgi:hypothetical protein